MSLDIGTIILTVICVLIIFLMSLIPGFLKTCKSISENKLTITVVNDEEEEQNHEA